MAKLKKVIWAIDPYAESEPQKKMIQALNALAKRTRFLLECVYVSRDVGNSILMQAYPDWPAHATELTKKRMITALKAVKSAGAKKAKILKPKDAKENVISAFLRYARKEKPDLIVLSTHARKGIERLLLGSFAETLILNTKHPLLIVNPSVARPDGIREIVFATDFSAHSRKAFRAVVDLAKILDAKLTLFHHFSDIALQIPEPGTLFIEPGLLQSLIQARKQDGTRWAKEAARKGVACKSVIDDSMANGLVDAILKYTKKSGPQLLALESRSGPLQTVILGSVARKLVRRSPCPVLVFR